MSERQRVAKGVAAVESIVARLDAAEALMATYLNRTEVRRIAWLESYRPNRETKPTGDNRVVLAKFETQQVTGSFKARGALHAMSRLDSSVCIFAASAGNHGLAVAWAASVLGRKANVVLPENASPLKRERCLQLGAGVISAGASVEDSVEQAKLLAARTGGHYLSPYNDIDVIAGQATVFCELLRTVPDAAVLVVPVGGGGLLSGAIAARAAINGKCHIVGVEPARFASMSASVSANAVVRLGRRPTFADGLATDIEKESITFDIISSADRITFTQVSEDALAAFVVGMFNRESVLCEAAGVAGLAACLDLDDEFEGHSVSEGPIATIVCGGNVHHNAFWQMAAFEQADPRLIAVTDTLGRTTTAEPITREIRSPSRNRTIVPESPSRDGAVPSTLLDDLVDSTRRTTLMMNDLVEFAGEQNLPLDLPTIELLKTINESVSSAASINAPASDVLREQRIRALTQLSAATRLGLEWRSPAYDQAGALGVFDLGALASPGVNYARYNQPGLVRIERQLAELSNINTETHVVLVTSSGMAAFALAVETIKMSREVKSVVTAPYLYFEASEMLDSWFGQGLSRSPTFDFERIARAALESDSDLVCADPLANHSEQRMVDVEALSSVLNNSSSAPHLLVDGTMLPITTARHVTDNSPHTAVYYESCSKYLQLGLDLAMAGMVVVPRTLEAAALRVRRNLGLGLDRYGVEMFPRYDPHQMLGRLELMERGALLVATQLREMLMGKALRVVFPGLNDHPDRDIADRYGRTGSCITLSSVGRQLDRDQLDPVVDVAVRKAALAGVPLTKGVSFGFTVSRLSAASAIAEGQPPFLRLAVGPVTDADATILAEVFASAVVAVSRTWPSQLIVENNRLGRR